MRGRIQCAVIMSFTNKRRSESSSILHNIKHTHISIHCRRYRLPAGYIHIHTIYMIVKHGVVPYHIASLFFMTSIQLRAIAIAQRSRSRCASLTRARLSRRTIAAHVDRISCRESRLLLPLSNINYTKKNKINKNNIFNSTCWWPMCTHRANYMPPMNTLKIITQSIATKTEPKTDQNANTDTLFSI